MLYSRNHDIGFAHYPKTGGHSLVAWFRSVFPDAAFVEPPEQYSTSHLPVRASLVRLGRATAPAQGFCNRTGRFLARTAQRLGAGMLVTHCPTRIIGVMREPFETIVSLFEYWRHYPFETEPGSQFMLLARRGTFPEFVRSAVIDRNLLKYEVFFDAYGPAWQTTRLIDFEHLDAGLADVCREFRIAAPAPLQRLNVGPSRNRTLDRYRTEAGPLVKDVRRHFRWYYDNAARIMVRGDRRCS
jgi:hypothetical protein